MPRTRPAASREQLIKVSTSLFATQGFKRTTLRAIADEAGVNQGMIHYYWGTKKALYEEVYGRVFEDFGRMVSESDLGIQKLDLESAKGREKMVRLIVEEAFSLIDRQPFISLIIARHMMGDAPGTEHLIDKYARPLLKLAETILEERMEQGFIHRQNLKLMIASFCFIYMGYSMGGGKYLFPEENFVDNSESRRKLMEHVEYLLAGAMLPK